MSEISKEYAFLRLKEIEKIDDLPRPPATMDCWHNDYGAGLASHLKALEKERQDLLKILGKDKPDKYMTSEEKFQKFGKSYVMLMHENAAKSILDIEA